MDEACLAEKAYSLLDDAAFGVATSCIDNSIDSAHDFPHHKQKQGGTVSFWTKTRRLAVGAAFVTAVMGATFAVAQTQTFFRIGTGGTAGTYYPIGGLLANIISGSNGGVSGLVATAIASNGSIANINAINGGSTESGFSQSDVAYWAHSGTGLFEGKGKIENLRAIATLYPETIHLVARKDSNIKSVADLKGKRVSLDEPGSGTLVDARIVLAAYGLTEKDIKAEYLKPGPSSERLRDGALDAYFFVGGYPTGAISELATSSGISLVPITGPQADKLLSQYRFFAKDTVPAGVYKDVGETPTISVNALWVTSAKQPADLVYNIVKTVYSDASRATLDAGHAKGKLIKLETAANGVGIPLHPGAERFYKEKGVLK
ncbi:MAG TPA: TAXI family TRAP transporter solute-binding subunit [Azospirillum sp.]|nr:TAXI family TRAP transporter solute-binding subunit [Azospirillum sp.]